MSHDTNADEATTLTKEKDYLYTVLNLSKYATPTEIKERHRALSLVFHPDKQHDEQTKDVATKKFLEIQKAYEVLSDSFLREVYDVLGEEGLKGKWAPSLRMMPAEELRLLLKRARDHRTQHQLESLVRPRGSATVAVDVSSLIEPYMGSPADPWRTRLAHRMEDVRIMSANVRHSIQKDLNGKTNITAAANISRPGSLGFSGTVRHQFSPRLAFEVTSSLIRLQPLKFRTTYKDEESALTVTTYVGPQWLRLAPPPINIQYARRLFRKSLTEAALALHVGPRPSVSLSIISPTPFDFSADPSPLQFEDDSATKISSVSGLQQGARAWSWGFILDENPRLTGSWNLHLSELALGLKMGFELGALGLTWLVGGSWAYDSGEIDANLTVGQMGVILKFEFAYLEQKLTLPLALSFEYDPQLAFWAMCVPSTALTCGYLFVIKPRRRKQRLQYIRAARRALKASDSPAMREIEATASMLKETAKRHTEAENAKDGLVIIEATYGLLDPSLEGDDLVINVTTALQALVNHSQLYIPGNRSKSGLQGFYDPAPSAHKTLRVRYRFRGRTHYAEYPDFAPIVLPQADHLVG
ncbi:hypothetical protein HGRIS_000326 [Hohenbuehelia grisea]|uniref:J domain-containing protein n=1 Tax=Hohenbuehelia grisea TaxID=104357 RepID=A0ABR3JQQ6_9AGAR